MHISTHSARLTKLEGERIPLLLVLYAQSLHIFQPPTLYLLQAIRGIVFVSSWSALLRRLSRAKTKH